MCPWSLWWKETRRDGNQCDRPVAQSGNICPTKTRHLAAFGQLRACACELLNTNTATKKSWRKCRTYITSIRRSIRTERKGGKLGLNKQRFHSHRNTKTLECEPAGGRAQPTISSNIHIDAVCEPLNTPTTEGVALATQNRYQRHKPVQRDPVAPQQDRGEINKNKTGVLSICNRYWRTFKKFHYFQQTLFWWQLENIEFRKRQLSPNNMFVDWFYVNYS